MPQNFSAMLREQPLLGPRDAIPRETADRFEERRAEWIVEIAGRQLARRLRQIVLDVSGELRQRTRVGVCRRREHPGRALHRTSLALRKVAYT